IYYSIKDAATPYIRSALLQNIGYLSSWQGSNSGLILRFAVVLFSSIVLFCLRRKMSFTQLFFLLWFIFSLFGALLSGRPYPHYLIEIVPSIAILTAITISEAKTNYRRIYPLLFAFILFFFSYFGFKFWRYPQLPYYKNFISFSTHKISREEYFSFWGNKTAENYQLANFIRLTTNPEEKIFVWGDAACVYALSNRLPTSKYTVNYHIFDFDALEETLETIKKEKPRLIIKLKEEKRPWSQLDSYLQKFYYPYGLLETEDEIFIRRL
ncbi:hypothetical protein KKF11_02360, partial [Patescibacteria group bacterium]|nr:hypothetical protein [Patescibacteria group bacterium]